jgi:hypothetical protein
MEIKTTITKQIFDANNCEIQIGDTVLIECDKDLIAKFAGYTQRGSLSFESLVSDRKFNVMPASIKSIYPISISMKGHKNVRTDI